MCDIEKPKNVLHEDNQDKDFCRSGQRYTIIYIVHIIAIKKQFIKKWRQK